MTELERGDSYEMSGVEAMLFTPLEQCLSQPVGGPLPSGFMAPTACTPNCIPSTPAKRSSQKRGAPPMPNSPNTTSFALNDASPRKRYKASRPLLLGEDSLTQQMTLSQESSMSFFPREDSEILMRAPTTNQYQNTFVEVRDIGLGSFGRVVLAKHNFDATEYAVKIYKRPVTSAVDRHNKLREARLLSLAAACPYIVRYYNAWVDDSLVHLQMEYCGNGCLGSILAETRWGKWSDVRIGRLLMNIAAALDHLHRTLKLVHLDVKPDNIFQCAGNDSHPSIPMFKLGDFGIAAKNPERLGLLNVGCSQQSMSQMSVVSLEDGDGRFVAPDMLNGKLFPKEADIFAFGLAVYEVASGIPTPYCSDPHWEIVRHEGTLDKTPLNKRGLEYLHPLLTRMVSNHVETRPTAFQVMLSVEALWTGKSEENAQNEEEEEVDECDGDHSVQAPPAEVPLWGVPSWFRATEAMMKCHRPAVCGK